MMPEIRENPISRRRSQRILSTDYTSRFPPLSRTILLQFMGYSVINSPMRSLPTAQTASASWATCFLFMMKITSKPEMAAPAGKKDKRITV